MMKTFEQRKAEIRRRSEKRIRKRRRRINRLAGAALCLICVAVGVVEFRPQTENNNASAKDIPYGYAGGAANEACEPAGQEDNAPAEMPEMYHEECTSLETGQIGLEITQIDTDEDTLTMALTNYSNRQITYSPWFDIEQQTENGWVSCAQEDMGWDYVLYILAPGDTATETYPMGSFDLSQPGTYRFVKDCNLYVEEDSTPYRVVAEFTVEEAP